MQPVLAVGDNVRCVLQPPERLRQLQSAVDPEAFVIAVGADSATVALPGAIGSIYGLQPTKARGADNSSTAGIQVCVVAVPLGCCQEWSAQWKEGSH